MAWWLYAVVLSIAPIGWIRRFAPKYFARSVCAMSCVWLAIGGYLLIEWRRDFTVRELFADNETPIQQALAAHDVPFDYTFQDGSSLLHAAVLSGNLSSVNVLLSMGMDVDPRDGSLVTPLLYAVSRGHLEIAEHLIAAGADIDAKGFRHRQSALHVAVATGQTEMFALLLKCGANPRATNCFGETVFDSIRDPIQRERFGDVLRRVESPP